MDLAYGLLREFVLHTRNLTARCDALRRVCARLNLPFCHMPLPFSRHKSPPLLPRSKSWLSQCLPVQSLSCRFLQFKDAQWSSGHPQRRGAWADVLCAVGLASLSSVPVEHCADAHAVVLSHASGWRLCYSGDTRPSRALARAAHGCTMLIHEATFEPGLQGQAERKRHRRETGGWWSGDGRGFIRDGRWQK